MDGKTGRKELGHNQFSVTGSRGAVVDPQISQHAGVVARAPRGTAWLCRSYGQRRPPHAAC